MSTTTTDTLTPIARPILGELMTYVPGKPIEEVQRELGLDHVIKLASNENALGPSPLAIEAMKAACATTRFYPEDTCYELIRELARYHDTPGEQIVIGRGSDEVIHYLGLALLCPGDECVMADPTFPMYPITTTMMEAKSVCVPLRDFTHDLPAMADAVTARTKIIFIANPHNPTGTIVRRDEVKALLDRVPERVVVVLDEAYFEYVDDTGYPDGLDYLRQGRPNVVSLRTFSKIHALAGLRIGYGLFPSGLASAVRKVRAPFNVSTIAQVAATASLRDPEHVEVSRRHNRESRRFLMDAFDAMGLSYAESHANFVFVDVRHDAKTVADMLLRRGVIVRQSAGFKSPTHVRVSFGREAENEEFVEALGQVLKELGGQ